MARLLGWIRHFDHADELTLLAILVALAAYLATIRLFLLGVFDAKSGRRRGPKAHRRLFEIGVADAFVTTSAFLVACHALFAAPPWVFQLAVLLASLAGVLLLGYHMYAWWHTFFGDWAFWREMPEEPVHGTGGVSGTFAAAVTLVPDGTFSGSLSGSLGSSPGPKTAP